MRLFAQGIMTMGKLLYWPERRSIRSNAELTGHDRQPAERRFLGFTGEMRKGLHSDGPELGGLMSGGLGIC